MKWKTLKSETIFENKWIRLKGDKVELPSGTQLDWFFVDKDPYALIIPWDGEKMTLVKQYRYPHQQELWEFPAGIFEHANIEETANAELQEEAGLIAGKIEELGTLIPSPAELKITGHIFFATNITQGEQQLEGAEEDLEIRQVTREEFEQMIIDGEIIHMPSIAAYQLAVLKSKF